MNNSQKPTMSFWQVWNMCFGFFGIQYGFGLQQANLSPIFTYHGASYDQLPLLWLAGPVTGLLVQPIIGAISDRTWSPRFGRRKPFFMWGALVGSVAVLFMPYVPELWMVVGLFWILDAGMNTAMEPYRAMVGDMVNRQQRPFAFALQTFMVSGGQILASLMPVILLFFGISAVTDGTEIPDIVTYSFVIGVVVILITATWSFNTTKEYPPENVAQFHAENQGQALKNLIPDLVSGLRDMPKSLRQLWWVKLATWFGLPLMWQYLSLSIAYHVYNAPTPDAPGFAEGTAHGGTAFAVMHATTLVCSFFIARFVHQFSDRLVYCVTLIVGGIGFLSMQLTTDLTLTLACMALVTPWGHSA